MVLLSCSGTGDGIYAKLANGVARHNCASASPMRNSVACTMLIEGLQRDNDKALVKSLSRATSELPANREADSLLFTLGSA